MRLSFFVVGGVLFIGLELADVDVISAFAWKRIGKLPIWR